MGRVVIKVLSDILKHRAHLEATCHGCGRRTIMRVAPLLKLFRNRRWNCDLSIAGYWFRCTRCNRRGARIEMVPPSKAPHLPPP
nr:hypothetical protein [uncultured Sphingomonas sp.]